MQKTQEYSMLQLRYQSSAEAMYTDIQVENGQLRYTFFTDPDNRCAQWFKSTPCWSEADLETQEQALSEPELAHLYTLASELLAVTWPKSVLGETNLRKRAYTEILTVSVSKDKQQVLRYRSSPQADPKPALFSSLESALHKLVTGLIQPDK